MPVCTGGCGEDGVGTGNSVSTSHLAYAIPSEFPARKIVCRAEQREQWPEPAASQESAKVPEVGNY